MWIYDWGQVEEKCEAAAGNVKERRKTDRSVCLLGEWLSLITVPWHCLPTPFLDNKALSSFISVFPQKQPALPEQTHAAFHVSETVCSIEHRCPFWVKEHKNMIFTIVALAEHQCRTLFFQEFSNSSDPQDAVYTIKQSNLKYSNPMSTKVLRSVA